MSMTRKHYKELARLISFTMASINTGTEPRIAVGNMARDLCTFLKQDNANFNRPKFLQACNIEDI